MTTRWPTPAIKYVERYEPMPFTRYRPMMAQAATRIRCLFGSTLSRMGLMRAARPADPAAYKSMPNIAQRRRDRYRFAYWNRRRKGGVAPRNGPLPPARGA